MVKGISYGIGLETNKGETSKKHYTGIKLKNDIKK
jgi:hypothetical protein